MSLVQITSPANPRLKAVAALRRRRGREERGRTVLEGLEELDLALASGVIASEIYHCADLVGDRDRAAAVLDRARAAGTAVIEVGRAAFEKIAYRDGPDGLLAVVPTPGGRLEDLHLPPDPLILIAESVEKPGNLGAMLRTADAAGVDAVVATDPVSDWGNPNVIRSSKGTVFSLPVATASRPQTLTWLGEHRADLIAATPEAEVEYTEVDLTGPVAIAVGTEKQGLTPELMSAATTRVRIPMAGRADSLNVSISAALLVYEAVRQRRTRR